MAIELKIPHIGESISEVQIAEWLKADGEEVKKDENVAVIDSEKTTLDLPAPENGRLKIIHQAGETVRVGEVVAQIEPGGSAEPKPKNSETKNGAAKKEPEPVTEEKIKVAGGNKAAEKSKPTEKTKVVEETKAKGTEEAKSVVEKTAPEKKSSPEAGESTDDEEKAEEKSAVENKKPVSAPEKISEAKSEPPKSGAEKIVPMTMLRRTVARRLVEAKQEMAMLTTFNEVDMSAVQTLRKEHQENFEKRYAVRLGFMSFFLKAVVGALKQFPQLNAEMREDDIVYHQRFDIGVAIASERGLVVPVLRNAEKMSFAEMEKAIGDFSTRAKEGKLKPAELEGGTFTITNGGVFGSLFSTPIINPPQTGILGMHSIQERPVALNGQVVIRPMMFIALSYDHRLVDGREAVLFLRTVKDAIDNPARMLMEL